MINFNALEFSECHSEDVISFLWGSVYICTSSCMMDPISKKQLQKEVKNLIISKGDWFIKF